MKVKSLSRVRLCVTPWTAAYQAPLSMGVSRQEYWSGGARALEWGAIAFSNLCLSINIYLILIVTSVFLAVLGLRCCGSFSPVVESSSYSLVAVCRLLIVMASLVAERRL